MEEYKILFTGPTGAGKTTAISSVSETPPIVTDVVNTDSSVNKQRTTVGLDFGQVTLDNGDCLRLFGTPGQVRFDFMWKVLAANALGLIILLDNSRPDPISDLNIYVERFADYLGAIPCVIGVGRTETHAVPTIDDYAEAVFSREQIIPIVNVDVRRREDVLMMIDVLLTQIEAQGVSQA